MIGSFDDAPNVEQMAAIGAALTHYGWAPRRTICGCARCAEEAFREVAGRAHEPDVDEDVPGEEDI